MSPEKINEFVQVMVLLFIRHLLMIAMDTGLVKNPSSVYFNVSEVEVPDVYDGGYLLSL